MAENDIIIPEIVDESEETKTVPMWVTGYGPAPVRAYLPPQEPVYEPVAPYSLLAVLSVICAAAAIPLWWTLLPAPLAVLFGFLAKEPTATGERRGWLTGKIGRIAGLIELGIVALVLIGLAVFSVASWYSSPYTTK